MAGGLVLVALIAIGFLLRGGGPTPGLTFNPETGCLDRPPDSQTILLIDATDPYSERQKKDLETIFSETWAALEPGEQFFIVKMSGGEPPSIPNPMTGTPICRMFESQAEMLAANIEPGIATPGDGSLKRTSEGFFNSKVSPLLKSIVDCAAESPDSLIFEYIKNVVTMARSPRWFGRSEKRPKVRLIIVSDFLQNSKPDFHYQLADNLTFSSFGKAKKSYYERVFANLGGADVKGYYVRRNKYAQYQTDIHRQFWVDYFKNAGAEFHWQQDIFDEAKPKEAMMPTYCADAARNPR